MNSEYEFAMFYNNFISDLLQKPHTLEMHQLLLAKKAQADKELLILYQICCKRKICLQEIKELRKGPESLDLFSNFVSDATFINKDYGQILLLSMIGKLPEDLVKLIGSYSPHVKNQKSLVRIEFYNNWFNTNKARITNLLKSWSKSKLGFVLNNIQSPNNPYYNCCLQGSQDYKKSYALIFRSLIEKLIEEKGQRSSMEQYSLLLAIEKYDKRK
jgi:hypothetical protein